MTPLSVSSQENCPDVAKLLLVNGAVVDLAGSDGATPLMMSCAFGNLGVARLLLANVARAGGHANSEGCTPLVMSCQKWCKTRSLFPF